MEHERNINRKYFLKTTAFSLIALSTSNTFNCKAVNNMDQKIVLSSLKEALSFLEKIENRDLSVGGDWDINQIFHHCSQSIEYSMSGYPINKNILFRKTIGKIVLSKFLSQGYMSHNLNDPIPGAPNLPEKTQSFTDGLSRLKEAIKTFQTYDKKTAPHFVYDEVSHEEYDRIHAMHLANHLSAFSGI